MYLLPDFLPDGKDLLFSIRLNTGFQTALLSLETGERKVVLENARQARYLSTGHVVYEQSRTGNLMVVPFDLAALEVTGDSVPVVQGVRQTGTSSVDYAISRNGMLVYVPAEAGVERSLVWVNREGNESLVTEERRNFVIPRISPDGKKMAVSVTEEDGGHNWIYDFEDSSFDKLTFEGLNTLPIWTPDGRWITYRSTKDGQVGNLYRRLADGSGPAERLTESQFNQTFNSWSPDGSVAVFQERRPESNRDIWILPMDGDKEPYVLISSPARDCCAAFSPDGKFLAYVSNTTGPLHVYVATFPDLEGKWQISGEEGGGEPVWSPDGTELFYRSGNQLIAVPIQTEPTFSAGRPTPLFEKAYVSGGIAAIPHYDISPDGQRFLMVKQEQGESQIHVVLNWFEELKRLVPTE